MALNEVKLEEQKACQSDDRVVNLQIQKWFV